MLRDRKENPVSEAIRLYGKENVPIEKSTCEDCEHYWEQSNWCYKTNRSTNTSDCCDDFKEYKKGVEYGKRD